ncbi:MAG: hypothetical protein H6717_40210 [Polyangiaceae bacterium]|nr:hypothetical protein [Polyangiaceae bacterium]
MALPACGSESSEAQGNAGAGGNAGTAGINGIDGGQWGGNGGTAGGGGSGGLAPLPCDPGFSFSEDPATVGKSFTASYSNDTGFTYVDLEVSGPGAPTASWIGVTGQGPYTWSYGISGHDAGVLSFSFVKDKNGGNPGTAVASCQIYAVGGGGTGGTGGGGTGGTSGSGGTTGGPPPVNRYGMGYVSEGNAADHDLTAKLVGPGGYVTVIFADIKPGRSNAEASWKQSIAEAYARDLIPVIRMAPPWGDRNVRAMGESPTSYKGLAQVYKNVIADLPKRDQWPMYVEVHNEANLCYEWACTGGSLSDKTMAKEYASLLRDAADALHSLGDSRIKVLNGALAPGGVTSCDCATQNGAPGTLAATFLGYMNDGVPGVFDKIDAFASHSYPAKGEGWGFFAPYAESGPGLTYFEKELAAIGKPSMKVLITETGWTIQHESYSWSRDQVADFTVDALKNVWLTHPNILGITPFILRDSAWDKFAWTQLNGTPYPVYTKVRAYRCAQPGAQNCN